MVVYIFKLPKWDLRAMSEGKIVLKRIIMIFVCFSHDEYGFKT